MAVRERPTVGECYLYALLKDPSGVDQAEFLWKTGEIGDHCWRAWPFQWRWFRDESPLQIEQSARSLGKSTSIKVRLFSFPFLYPGQEAVITAPELVHLNPIVDLIESAVYDCAFTRDMLPKGRKTGVTHRPFQMNFVNGSRIIGRIPQKTGAGIKGTHPIVLEMDEAQDYGEPGWTEINATLKTGFPGASWRAHGVTRGVRDTFFKLTQPGTMWKVHRYNAMWRPTWNDAERRQNIELYGSRESPDYKRNILGLHGDETSPFMVLTRLMNCVDTDATSAYNQEYVFKKIDDGLLIENDGNVAEILNLPEHHLTEERIEFFAGMDVGYTTAPSEIVVFAQERPDKSKPFVLRLVTRIQLNRVDHRYQVETMLHLARFYNIRSFGMDKTGLGLPLFQDVQERAPDLAGIFKGYGFSEKILVDLDQTIEVDEHRDDPLEKAGIKKNVLEHSSDQLRIFVDTRRLILPWDKELIGEFQGQTYVVKKDTMNVYGKKIYSQGTFHVLDACRMMILAVTREPMEALIDMKKNERMYADPVVDIFL